MYSKIQITGVLETKTGMHIGGSSAFSAIGAVDSPVIKDVRNGKPMVPGSSLKGKIRTLLAKKYNEAVVNPDNDAECIRRVFGSAKKDKDNKIHASKIIVSDMFLMNEDEIRNRGIESFTEVKFENSINRATAVANPRQIERAIKGLQFGIDMIYEVENGKEDEVIDDIKLLAEGMKMLEYDYLGGSGSRGYGKVQFFDMTAKVVIGALDDSVVAEVNEVLAQI
ncbi:MAG: type III-A CRISPR-associated RAMP protein Csm3 [Lachnospira sp.]